MSDAKPHTKPPDELAVIEKCRDLLRDLIPRLHKFPRNFRHTLGQRAELTALAVLEDLIEARYSRPRVAILRRANVRLERLRHLMRLAQEFGLVAKRGYLHNAGLINEVGAMLGAWGKKSRAGETPAQARELQPV